VNVEEKVATLEALLARVKNNAAQPRVQRRTAEPNGEARLAKPEARSVELAVAALQAPPARPIEKVAPARAAVPAALPVFPEPPDLLDAKLEKPVEAKAAKAAQASVDAIDVWADALAEVPKAQDKPPAKRDEGTPKPAPIAASAITPVAAKPITPRPITPVARPVVARPTASAKPEATPSPTPAVVKPIVEKVAPVVAAPKPVEKIAPVVAPTKPVEKVAATAKSTDKLSAVKAPVDQSRADLDALRDPPTKPEVKLVTKLVEAVAVAPAKMPPLPVKAPPLPVEPVKAKLPEAQDSLDPQDDETQRVGGSIPDPELPTIVDETTSDDETIVVSLGKANELDVDESTIDVSDKAEGDEPTQVFDSRGSRPDAPLVTPDASASEGVSASDELKVVVSPAVRVAAVVKSAVPEAAENAAAIKIIEAVAPPARPSETDEATAPSRRYLKPENDVAEPVAPRPNRRASTLTLGLVAAVLVGAVIYRGLRDGWFESSTTPVVSTTPTASALPRPAPTPSAPTITTASAAVPTTSAAPPVTPEPTSSASAATSASAAPAASASAAPTASVAPSTAPTTAPAADGDGTQLPATRGFIVVTSAKPGSVFLTGRFVGATNTRLEVDCGAKFLRLAAPSAEGAARPAVPDWTSEGRSIGVACRAVTTIALEATR
jgi:hypothetical protein